MTGYGTRVPWIESRASVTQNHLEFGRVRTKSYLGLLFCTPSTCAMFLAGGQLNLAYVSQEGPFLRGPPSHSPSESSSLANGERGVGCRRVTSVCWAHTPSVLIPLTRAFPSDAVTSCVPPSLTCILLPWLSPPTFHSLEHIATQAQACHTTSPREANVQ